MYERHGYDIFYKCCLLFRFYLWKSTRLVNIKHFYLQARLLVTYIRYKKPITKTIFYCINSLNRCVFICVPHIEES